MTSRGTIDVARPVTLALDAMSGDRGAAVVVDAAESMLRRHGNVRLILVGNGDELRDLVSSQNGRLEIRHADEVVQMNESPADALRRKKNSSMRIAVNLVKDGAAAACVSAGNTGALMATSKFVLKTVTGIDRPAIMAEIPARNGSVHLLDVGANAMCSAHQLYQFAVMGSIVTSKLKGVAKPRVGLLNIGTEDSKGNDVVREAAEMLENSGLNYVGFVEGNTIFDHAADVVVTDGFTGNVALKTMEGTASLIAQFLRETFSDGWIARLQGAIALPALQRLRARVDPRAYNGASLVGLNGIVVKSHGGADAIAFEHALETALLEVQDNLPAEINRWLQDEAA
ncbi:MAG: phosphate acyltransferase PlsX [Pseudomonadota bacterium]